MKKTILNIKTDKRRRFRIMRPQNVLTRIYKESLANNNILYDSDSVTLYRMSVPQEIWMKRETSKISKVLAEVIVDNEITV